ncbi:MAG TPA: PH domain-containing protein [Micromonosporaceae bacterium]
MGFPDDSLTDGEQAVLHLHPHWKAMIAPGFWTVVAIAGVIAGALFLPSETWANVGLVVIGGVALVLFLWLALWPFVVWRSTHFVFTNERVLLREGVFNRQQRDIPLSRVNDVSSNQSLLDRMLGCGRLTVESAGERGQSVLTDIPNVVRVQKVVYELVEADHARRTVDDADLRAALREAGGNTDR